MATRFWTSGFCSTTGDEFSYDNEHASGLLAFISHTYRLKVPLIDTTSPNLERGLGLGASGSVELFRLGHDQHDSLSGSLKVFLTAGTAIAVKRSVSKAQQRTVMNELRVLSHIPLRSHNNLVRLLGWSIKADAWSVNPVLIFEASTLGDLSKYLRSSDFDSRQAYAWTRELTEAVQSLHSCQVAHADIKSSNILLFENDGPGLAKLTAKLCDFGSSKILSDHGNEEARIFLPYSYPFNAPECTPHVDISILDVYATDWYSLGMVLWDIWSMGHVSRHAGTEIPFKNDINEMKKTIHDSLDEIVDFSHDQFGALLTLLLGLLNPDTQLRTQKASAIYRMVIQIAAVGTDASLQEVVAATTFCDPETSYPKVDSKPIPIILPVSLNPSQLIHTIRATGRRVQRAVFDELTIMAKEGHISCRASVHELLSFCYLTGYGTERDSRLFIEEITKAALAGSRRAAICLPRYCNALKIDLPGGFKPWRDGDDQGFKASRDCSVPGQVPVADILNITDAEVAVMAGHSQSCIDCDITRTPPLGFSQQASYWKTQVRLHNYDRSFRDKSGNSLLHYACLFGDVDDTLKLLKGGVVPNENAYGITVLHWLACFRGQSATFILPHILQYQPNVNAVAYIKDNPDLVVADWDWPSTPLVTAILLRRRDVVALLLSHGADPWLPRHRNALQIAARLHEHNILQDLMEATDQKRLRDTVSTPSESLYDHALNCDNIMNRLVRHGERYREAAALTLRLLSDAGLALCALSREPLQRAIFSANIDGNSDILECLLEHGSCDSETLNKRSTDAHLLTPLHCAMATSARNAVATLLKYGADTETPAGLRNNTYLHSCSRADDDDAIYFAKLVLESDRSSSVDLEARDIDGYTPFMLACRFQRTELARYLLNKGAQAWTLDNDGYTLISSCLSKSAFLNLLAIIPDLDDHDYICHPGMGVTALHHVVEWADDNYAEAWIMLTEILHAAPQLINKTTKINGRTALFSAVRRGRGQMLAFLLQHGADKMIKDNSGITAIDLAMAMYSVLEGVGRKTEAANFLQICHQLGAS